MTDTTTISCSQDTKAVLEELKQDGETWDQLLLRLAGDPPENPHLPDDYADRLARLEETVEAIPERTADDLEQRFR